MKKLVLPENKSVNDFRLIGGISGEDAMEPGPPPPGAAPPACGADAEPPEPGEPALCAIRLPLLPLFLNDLFFFDMIHYYYHRELFHANVPVKPRITITNSFDHETHFSTSAFPDAPLS